MKQLVFDESSEEREKPVRGGRLPAGRPGVAYRGEVRSSLGRLEKAELVLVNRTTDEKEARLARVYNGKARDSTDGVLVRVRTAYEKGGFSDLSSKKEPPPIPPKKV